jgi:Secretion system C-terminal sorting domain
MKLLIYILLLVGTGLAAQAPTVIQFKYDAAGNQAYRGTDINFVVKKKAQETPSAKAEPEQEATKTEAKLQIYPVPVTDILFVDWGDKLLLEVAAVQIFDLKGQLLYHNTQLPANGQKLEINVESYPTGTYLINLLLKNGKNMGQKIIKN